MIEVLSSFVTNVSWQMHFFGPKNIQTKSIFFEKKIFCFIFPDDERWAKHFWPCVKKLFAWSSRLHCTCPLGKFDNFFRRSFFFLSFRDIERFFFDFLLESFRRGCENCILRVHRSVLVFWKKVKILSSSDFHRYTFGEVVETAFCLSIGTFWWKKVLIESFSLLYSFSDSERSTFSFLSEISRQECQICIQRVHRL